MINEFSQDTLINRMAALPMVMEFRCWTMVRNYRFTGFA